MSCTGQPQNRIFQFVFIRIEKILVHAYESESEYIRISEWTESKWPPLLCVPLFLFKWVSEYMLVRVGLTDCVNVCACVSSSRVRGAGCVYWVSLHVRPTTGTSARGALKPLPEGPNTFSFSLFLL